MKQELSCHDTVEFDANSTSVDLQLASIGDSTMQPFNIPWASEDSDGLKHKTFSPDTMKKVKWVTKMYREWRNY